MQPNHTTTHRAIIIFARNNTSTNPSVVNRHPLNSCHSMVRREYNIGRL